MPEDTSRSAQGLSRSTGWLSPAVGRWHDHSEDGADPTDRSVGRGLPKWGEAVGNSPRSQQLHWGLRIPWVGVVDVFRFAIAIAEPVTQVSLKGRSGSPVRSDPYRRSIPRLVW